MDEHDPDRQETLTDWLDELAEAEGLSREAMLEHLISSYWRLEEVADLLGDPDSTTSSGPPEGRGRTTQPAAGGPSAGAELDRLKAVVAMLAERVDRLETELDEGSSPSDPAREATALDERLSALETSVPELRDQLSSLQRSAVSEESFGAVIDQTRSFQGAMTARHESLHDHVRTEFDHIRTLLEHLLETTVANADRTERVVTEFEEPIRAFLAERETIETITRTAIRRGIASADCEHCGQSVDLSMLVSPHCPSCEHEFQELEPATGFFGWWRPHGLTVDDADPT